MGEFAGLIRNATAADAAAITAIYSHHVLHGTATFDTIAPSIDVMASKIESFIAQGWPFLVADEDGAVVGYAYAAQFRDREAYRYACENSIYILSERRGHGIGKALLAALIPAAEEAGFRQMIAVIGGGEPASVALHESCGFRHAGRMQSVGRKFDRWLDTVYMQRALGAGDDLDP